MDGVSVRNPRCGNCGNLLSRHFVVGGDRYCDKNTTELFSANPSGDEILHWIRIHKPEVIVEAASAWQVENGHAGGCLV